MKYYLYSEWFCLQLNRMTWNYDDFDTEKQARDMMRLLERYRSQQLRMVLVKGEEIP